MIKKFISEKIMDNIGSIYKSLNAILYEYEDTNGFDAISQNESYDKRLQHIRKDVDHLFWHCREIREKLYNIIDDILYITGSAEIPGVPERWNKVNPCLKYFDGVFDMIDDDFDSYQKIKDGKMCFSFKFIPTLEDYIERKNYLELRKKKYENCNIDVTEDRLYQDELVATFSVLFAMEFSQYVIENR